MHDPFQSHALSGAFSGAMNPFAALQNNPWTAQQGFQSQQPYSGINPLQQLQTGQIGIPQTALLQNPLIAAVQQNPLLLAALQSQQNQLAAMQNPYMNPFVAQQVYGQQGIGQQQLGNPFSQLGFGGQQGYGPHGYGLAPQTWVGHSGQIGNPYAQMNPTQFNPILAQIAARQFQTPGLTPWGMY